jgi:predicted protein tyrosine phosphatase
VVVHHVREVVRGAAVALEQDLVVDLRVVEADLAAELRARSVSSIRRTNCPPCLRARA